MFLQIVISSIATAFFGLGLILGVNAIYNYFDNKQNFINMKKQIKMKLYKFAKTKRIIEMKKFLSDNLAYSVNDIFDYITLEELEKYKLSDLQKMLLFSHNIQYIKGEFETAERYYMIKEIYENHKTEEYGKILLDALINIKRFSFNKQYINVINELNEIDDGSDYIIPYKYVLELNYENKTKLIKENKTNKEVIKRIKFYERDLLVKELIDIICDNNWEKI